MAKQVSYDLAVCNNGVTLLNYKTADGASIQCRRPRTVHERRIESDHIVSRRSWATIEKIDDIGNQPAHICRLDFGPQSSIQHQKRMRISTTDMR